LGALVGAYIHIQLSVIVNEIDEHILQIFHVITSRELTSGFDFWSRGHRCMAVTRLPMKFGGDIFIQCGIIDIFFSKLKIRHLGFVWMSHGTTHETSFVEHTTCKFFCHDRSFQVIRI